jgi:hypothetical protein
VEFCTILRTFPFAVAYNTYTWEESEVENYSAFKVYCASSRTTLQFYSNQYPVTPYNLRTINHKISSAPPKVIDGQNWGMDFLDHGDSRVLQLSMGNDSGNEETPT